MQQIFVRVFFGAATLFFGICDAPSSSWPLKPALFRLSA